MAFLALVAFLLTAIMPMAVLAEGTTPALNTIKLDQNIPAISDDAWKTDTSGINDTSAIAVYQWVGDNATVTITGADANASQYSYVTGTTIGDLTSTNWQNANTSVQQYSANGISLTAQEPAALVRYADTTTTTTTIKYIGILLTGVTFKEAVIESNPPASNGIVAVDAGTPVSLMATVTGTYGANNTTANVEVPANQIQWGTLSNATFDGITNATGSTYTPPTTATTQSTTYACQINVGNSKKQSNSITVSVNPTTTPSAISKFNVTSGRGEVLVKGQTLQDPSGWSVVPQDASGNAITSVSASDEPKLSFGTSKNSANLSSFTNGAWPVATIIGTDLMDPIALKATLGTGANAPTGVSANTVAVVDLYATNNNSLSKQIPATITHGTSAQTTTTLTATWSTDGESSSTLAPTTTGTYAWSISGTTNTSDASVTGSNQTATVSVASSVDAGTVLTVTCTWTDDATAPSVTTSASWKLTVLDANTKALALEDANVSLAGSSATISATASNVTAGQVVALTLQIPGANAITVQGSVETDSSVTFTLSQANITALKDAMGTNQSVTCNVSATAAGASTDPGPVTLLVAPTSITLTQPASSETVSVSLTPASVTLSVGDEETLSASVEGTDSTITYTWVSSDPRVATVSPLILEQPNTRQGISEQFDGRQATVRAMAPGSARITVTATPATGDPVSAYCEITVTPLSIIPAAQSVVQGNSVTLTAQINGTNAAQGAGTWSVTDVPVNATGNTTLGIVTSGSNQNNTANPLQLTVPADTPWGAYEVTYTPADTSIPPRTATVVVLLPNWKDVDVDGPTAVQTGDTIRISVTTYAPGLSSIISTTGLQFVDVRGGLSDADSLILLPFMGSQTATYVYRVTGAAGTTASFTLSSSSISDGIQEATTTIPPWSATIGSAQSSQYAVVISGPNSATPGSNATFTAMVTPPAGQTVPTSATYNWYVTNGAENVVLTPSGNTATVTARRANSTATIAVSVSGLGASEAITATHVLNITATSINPPVTPDTPVTPSSPSPSTSTSANPSENPSAGASDQPTTGPTTEPSLNPVSPVPDSPIDFEVTDNPTVGGDALEGIDINTNTGITPSIADLLTFSNLPAGSQMIVTTPDGAVVAWNMPTSTGQIVIVRDASGNIISQSTVVVKGDVLGIGRINLSQVVRLASAYRGTDPLSGAFLAAGKWTESNDQTITLTDLVIQARLYRTAGMNPTR